MAVSPAQPGLHSNLGAVLRPATVVGPGIDSIMTRHFEAPRLLVVRDSQPRWQFCHVDDLVSALELAAAGLVAGDFAVGCDAVETNTFGGTGYYFGRDKALNAKNRK